MGTIPAFLHEKIYLSWNNENTTSSNDSYRNIWIHDGNNTTFPSG